MDVHLTEEQELLQESAREFLASECPMELVRKTMEDARGSSEGLWRKMAELGWTGLIVPEEFGGAGLDLLSLSLVCQEIGRVLAPEPFLSTVALGAFAIREGGSDEQKRRWLPPLAEGNLQIALAQLEEDLSWDPLAIAVLADQSEDAQLILNGRKRFAVDAPSADLLLVPVRDSEGVLRMVVLETDRAGITIEPVASIDATRKIAEIVFDDVRVETDSILGDDAQALLERTLDFAKVALCAEMLGGAERVLEMSVDYAKHREQFGKPIGSFQAIQHKCSNQFIEVESMRSAVYYATWAIDSDESDAHLSACLAKSFCSEAYSHVASEGIQIHGGLGFTWEQDLHLYFKRAKSSELLFGDPVWNRELAARALFDSN